MIRYQVRSGRPACRGAAAWESCIGDAGRPDLGSLRPAEHDPADQRIEAGPGGQRLLVGVDREHRDPSAADPPLDRQQVRARLAQRDRRGPRPGAQDREIERLGSRRPDRHRRLIDGANRCIVPVVSGTSRSDRRLAADGVVGGGYDCESGCRSSSSGRRVSPVRRPAGTGPGNSRAQRNDCPAPPVKINWPPQWIQSSRACCCETDSVSGGKPSQITWLIVVQVSGWDEAPACRGRSAGPAGNSASFSRSALLAVRRRGDHRRHPVPGRELVVGILAEDQDQHLVRRQGRKVACQLASARSAPGRTSSTVHSLGIARCSITCRASARRCSFSSRASRR